MENRNSGNSRLPRGLAGKAALHRRQLERNDRGYVGVGGPPQKQVPTPERETPRADVILGVRSETLHPRKGELQEHYRAD